MGQKVNPHGIRLGIVKTWDAKWYADKDFADNLHEDIKIRDYLKNSLQAAGVSRIETERSKNRLKLTIHTAKPGMVIGKGGAMLKKIATFARQDMERFFGIKVNLHTWVKVKEDWRNREGLIHNFGLDNE